MKRAGALVLAAALAAAGCRVKSSEVENPAHAVVLAPVELRDVEEHVAAAGQLVAKQRAEVAAQVPGEVTAIVADEGEPVAEGAVVIEIDPDRRALDLDRARALAEPAPARDLDRRLLPHARPRTACW